MKAAKIIMLRITPHSIRTPDITTFAAKSRLTAVRKAAILTKRMSEALTTGAGYTGMTACAYVPRGLTRRVGIAVAGSSGQGCRG